MVIINDAKGDWLYDPKASQCTITDHMPARSELNNIGTIPIGLVYRGTSRLKGKQWSIDQEKSTIDGVSCIRLIVDTADGLRTTFWVDTRRHCLPVQYREEVNRSVIQANIDYDFQAKNEAPTGWTSSWVFADGSVKAAVRVTDVNVKLNADVLASEFSIQIPKGTKVIDTRKGNGAVAN